MNIYFFEDSIRKLIFALRNPSLGFELSSRNPRSGAKVLRGISKNYSRSTLAQRERIKRCWYEDGLGRS